VLSGRGLCDELITRPEEPYRLWCVIVCDLETSRMRRPWPERECSYSFAVVRSDSFWAKDDWILALIHLCQFLFWYYIAFGRYGLFRIVF